MSITDELRRVAAKTECANGRCEKLYRGDLDHIADRIDAEYEETIQQVLMGEGGVPATDENMADHGWVRLPLDADGVPWHIGDVTENGQTVSAMGLNKHGWHFVGTVNDIDPTIHRHHRPDTWERIIEDATALGAQMGRRTTQVDDLVARCKALAGDAE